MRAQNQAIDTLLKEERDNILKEWTTELANSGTRTGAGSEAQQASLLQRMQGAVAKGVSAERFDADEWGEVRDFLEEVSRTGAAQGSSAANTSMYVLALKRPMFSALQRRLATRPKELVDALWEISTLVDQMAQWTVSTYQRTREDIIQRQQHELLELSTPVIKMWEGVLAVPMIGTLDSSRTQLVMEALLQRIVETGSTLAIIDITGVPTVDTLVAQHLLKTVTAIRLMGADAIISGIRPQIAQTIVHLGIDLREVTTKATLAEALALALARNGFVVSRQKA